MTRSRAVILAILLVGVAPTPAAAEVTASLPLGGYYRPGRFMPVRLAGDAARISSSQPTRLGSSKSGAVTISATGAVPVEVAGLAGGAPVVTPVLMTSAAARELSVTADGATVATLPLTPLGEQDRLIGVAVADSGPATALAAELFPGAATVPAVLDLSAPLPGNTAAWDTLDALVIDTAALGRLPPSAIGELLAAGTAVVVPGGDAAGAPPVPGWPWERLSSTPGWALRYAPVGPRGAIAPEAYLPADAWAPGWHVAYRRRAVLLAVFFAILALAASLWRSRLAVALVALLAIGTVFAARAWVGVAGVFRLAQGRIEVVDGPFMQSDQWTYVAGITPTEMAEVPPGRVVFASRAHLERLRARSFFNARNGTFVMFWQTDPRMKAATLRRTVTPAGAAATRPIGAGGAGTSPLRPLATQAYLGPGMAIVGERPESAAAPTAPDIEGWGTVVIERR